MAKQTRKNPRRITRHVKDLRVRKAGSNGGINVPLVPTTVNGRRALRKRNGVQIDQRSWLVREYNALVDQVVEDHGGPDQCSAVQLTDIENWCLLQTFARHMSAETLLAFSEGKRVGRDLELLIAVIGSANRLRLPRARIPRDVTPKQSLAERMRAKVVDADYEDVSDD